MVNFTPTLCTDYYKECHFDQYDSGMTKLVSYYTPRMSRVEDKNIAMFGLQYFIKSFLIDSFNRGFFKIDKYKAVAKYYRLMKYTMGDRFADTTRWEKLWDLGYLPLEINAVAEGTRVPMKCPMIEITNTLPDFVWLVNYIETAMSCNLWHSMASANVGYQYRKIVNKFYSETVEDSVPRSSAIGDFSMRGQESEESATKSSAAFLLSFTKTATIPAIEFLEEYYNCNIENETVATGLASTEHSVMCSSALIDGNETDMVKRLLTEIYPNDNFTMVSDSYDYWSMISNVIASPEIRELVLNHNGFIGIRGDSGSPVDILCGINITNYDDIEEMLDCERDSANEIAFKSSGIESCNRLRDYESICMVDGKYYEVVCEYNIEKEHTAVSDTDIYFVRVSGVKYKEIECKPEFLGTVELLWNIFGGTVNSKGFKVLDSHVKAVYGDSITPERAKSIYQRLKNKGFASDNVMLGMGSYSLQSAENNTPLTRDTYSVAVKSTYCEVGDKKIMVFKDPKTDSGNFKKSQKGCCVVFKDEVTGEIKHSDGMMWNEKQCFKDKDLLMPVFKDGKLLTEYSLSNIRDRLHGGNF